MPREVNVWTSKPVVTAATKDDLGTIEMDVRYQWTPSTAASVRDVREATVKARWPDVLKLMPEEYVAALAQQVLIDYARLQAGVDDEVKG